MEIDIIKNSVEGLSEEQLNAIVKLTTEREESLTRELTGKIHQSYDDDLRAMGFEKPQGLKTYEHNKMVITQLKGDKEQLAKEVAELKEALAKGEGNDKTLTKMFEDEKQRVAELQAELKTAKSKQEELEASYKAQMHTVKVEGELDRALSTMTFSNEVDRDLQRIAIERAKAEVLKDYKAEFENGVLIFRDSDGKIKNNAQNGMKPYTATELLSEKSYLKAILKNERVVGGAGGNGGGNGRNGIVDLSGCRTQVEADNEISKYLMGKGMTRATEAYQAEFSKLRKELEVEKLKLF